MEIERLNNAARPIGGTDAIGDAARRGARITPPTSDGLTIGADTIEISDQARKLAQAQEAVSSAPDVRQERVAQIKQRVEDGTYSVPVELLAQRLLDGWSNGR